MRTSLLTSLLVFLMLNIGAQSVKKAYKNLEKSEHTKAKELFKKDLAERKDNVASNFGMAMIFADDQSPFFDIVESWHYIDIISGRTSELSQEELEFMGSYFYATETRKTSRPVKKKINIAVEAVENRLIKYIREENDLEAVYKVLEKYPDYKHYDNVVHIRNQFEFRKYEKMNTMAGYKEFIEKFPESAQVKKANRHIYDMAFAETKRANSVLSYNQYIKNFPESRFRQQAIKLRNSAAFKVAKEKNTLLAYEGFIALYPDALEIPEARKHQHDLMYEKAKRIKSIEAYNEFIRMYPDGTYYVDVFNLKAKDLGNQHFKRTGLAVTGLKWVKALDNNEYIDNAQAMAITKNGGYVIAGTTRENDTAYTDAWLVKLDADGQMIWNKTIGQEFNDKISEILITSNDEIIVIGYTQVTNDSSSYLGWIFKLGADGSREWNKNIGKITIAASAISPEDKVYLSTYVSDTVSDKFYVQALNQKGQIVWERDYTRNGVFNSISFSESGDVLLSGSNWMNYTDSKFYIKWEDTLSVAGNYLSSDIKSGTVFAIAGDSVNKYFFSYDLATKKTPLKLITDNGIEEITQMISTPDNNPLVISKAENKSIITKLNLNGNVLGSKNLINEFEVIDAIKNKTGGISYLVKSEDYLVVTYSSDGF